jgi:hypothetical protein
VDFGEALAEIAGGERKIGNSTSPFTSDWL